MKKHIQLIEFEQYADNYIKRNPGERKIHGNIHRAYKTMKEVFLKHAEEINDIKRENCYEEKGVIIRDSKGNYQFSKANEKKMMVEINELLNKEHDLDFSKCYLKVAPTDLTEQEIDSFEGIILSEEMANEIRKTFE